MSARITSGAAYTTTAAALESPLPADRRTDPIPRLRHHRHAGGPPGTDGRPAYGAAEFTAVGTGREGINQGEHSPVFFRTDRFALLDSGTFWLSETPEKVSRGWDADYNRICSWVKLRDRQSKKEFFYFNTHLDHMGPVARHEGAELICRRIASLAGDKYPVFCTGDFNAEPKDEPIKVMLQHLASARDVSQTPPYDQGSEVSWTGVPVGAMTVTIPEAQRGRQAIDHVFVNGRVDVLKYGLLRDSDGINYPSDHIPILVRATLK